MTDEQIAAVMSCTPRFAKWSMGSRRQLENRVKVEHANGRRALIRSAAIIRGRDGVREVQRGVDVIGARTPVGTRYWYLHTNNTVEQVDDWN